jgi:hypothetical protein
MRRKEQWTKWDLNGMRLANIGVSPNREKSQPNGARLELKKTKGLMNKMRL